MEQSKNNIAQKKAKAYAVKSPADMLHIKDVDMTGRIVTGFYSTANYFDSDRDVILPGATSKSITENGPASTSVAKIKHLMFHDWTLLPGKIQTLTEKTMPVAGVKMTGLYFETLMAKTQLGTDTLTNYQEGIYDNHSIGYQYMDGEWIDEDADGWQKALDKLINPDDAIKVGYMYLWKEIKLWEGSTVAFGANDMTPYFGLKAEDADDVRVLKLQQKIINITNALKNGTQSDEMMFSLQMQLKQLSQVISEIFQPDPSIKSTMKSRRAESSIAAAEEINLNEVLVHPFFQS